MKDLAFGLLFAAVIGAVVVGITWFSLIAGRPMAKYAKETERQVYQNSVARQQGANNGIAQDCANMEANTGPEKLAFARFVMTDAAAYAGDRGLSDDALRCVSEARGAVAASPQ